MATTTHITSPVRITSPLALWHLLSLDAPTVAALWTFFAARATHTAIPLSLAAAMFLAVWIVYAADRLLDTRHLHSSRCRHTASELEARHLFHFRHRRAFVAAIPIAAIAVAALLPDLLTATIHLYLVEGAVLMGWFLLVHATHSRLPKELVVGLYFAAATFTPTMIRDRHSMPALLAAAALFATACTLNCLFIHAWEDDLRSEHMHLKTASLILCVIAVTAAVVSATPAIPAAVALAAGSLLTVHALRNRLSRTHLRAAADLALLTPAVILPLLR